MSEDHKFIKTLYELTDEEINRKIEEIWKKRAGNFREYGKDGTVPVSGRLFEYRGVPYEIHKMQYFSFNYDPPTSAKINGVSQYLVLEHNKTDETVEVSKIVRNLFDRFDWLWEDTLHAGMEGWSLEQMEKWLHERAKEDIDYLLDEVLPIFKMKMGIIERFIDRLKSEVEE